MDLTQGTLEKKNRGYSVRLTETEHKKLMAIKKRYNLSVFFRKALDEFYQENIANKESKGKLKLVFFIFNLTI